MDYPQCFQFFFSKPILNAIRSTSSNIIQIRIKIILISSRKLVVPTRAMTGDDIDAGTRRDKQAA